MLRISCVVCLYTKKVLDKYNHLKVDFVLFTRKNNTHGESGCTAKRIFACLLLVNKNLENKHVINIMYRIP